MCDCACAHALMCVCGGQRTISAVLHTLQFVRGRVSAACSCVVHARLAGPLALQLAEMPQALPPALQ